MNIEVFDSIRKIGETVAVEFKRCGNGIEHDTYETVCSFLNRFGGDIFMGVLDDGSVVGVPENTISGMIKNFISVVSNPALFSPTVYLEPEILNYQGRMLLHIHVPPSSEVHTYKRVIYDRVNDSDVKVTATAQIAALYIRKQSIFTEKRIYPYVTMDDLRIDLLPKIRQMAVNNSMETHPWKYMDDEELLRSAGLYGVDRMSGERGYNLAAIMLLGRDEVIQDIVPAYVTDAIVRKVNIDRYDDREIIKTNLIESYDLLMNFARKHLMDKFFLDGERRISLRNVIAREMLVNTLIHREMTSTFIAKFVIEKDRMYVENANRAVKDGLITPENMEPNPKNPIIASFFRNIGYSDQLGSGVRNLYKYTKFYSGREPELIEGDIFRIIVPLDDYYSFDYDVKTIPNDENTIPNDENTIPNDENTIPNDERTILNLSGDFTETQKAVIRYILDNPEITQAELAGKLDMSVVGIKYVIKKLKEKDVIYREGSNRGGYWVVKIQLGKK